MPTLRIEHPVTDFDTWRSAFDRFADKRSASGVVAQRIWRPIDDERYVVLDLDFDTPEHIKAAARQALDRGLTKYTPIGGLDQRGKAAAG